MPGRVFLCGYYTIANIAIAMPSPTYKPKAKHHHAYSLLLKCCGFEIMNFIDQLVSAGLQGLMFGP
jgi:hypothetical protein